jgi:hypothetical protein
LKKSMSEQRRLFAGGAGRWPANWQAISLPHKAPPERRLQGKIACPTEQQSRNQAPANRLSHQEIVAACEEIKIL